MAGRLEGKAAVVVGAGQTPGETIGNGRAMAVLFAREGARVLCVDLVRERAEETVALIQGEGGSASAVQADVRRADQCGNIVSQAVARLGRIDILANNVGIVGPGTALSTEEGLYDQVMEVNLKSMWLMTKAVLPVLREQGAGAIVNISSGTAISGCTSFAYELSKAGVNRLTTSVAASNADRGVRCNAIMPGFLDTPMGISGAVAKFGLTAEEVRRARDDKVPLRGKQGTAWDTAYAALFLASDEAGFITGVLLSVDGGLGVASVVNNARGDRP